MAFESHIGPKAWAEDFRNRCEGGKKRLVVNEVTRDSWVNDKKLLWWTNRSWRDASVRGFAGMLQGHNEATQRGWGERVPKKGGFWKECVVGPNICAGDAVGTAKAPVRIWEHDMCVEIRRGIVMYHYIIAPACNSICSHGIHSPLRGPNSQYASLLSVMLLFCSFPLFITCSIMSLFPSVPLSCASIVHGPIVFS